MSNVKCGVKKIKLIFQGLMTFFMFLVMFLLLNSLIKHSLPNENKEIVYMITGYISGALSTCMQFWFGNTSSAIDKDSMIYNSTPIKKEPNDNKE